MNFWVINNYIKNKRRNTESKLIFRAITPKGNTALHKAL